MPASNWGKPTAQVGTKPDCGQQTGVGTTPVVLGVSEACCSVAVQNDPASAVQLIVGILGKMYWKVPIGQSLTIGCQNVNQIYVATASGTATVNWFLVS